MKRIFIFMIAALIAQSSYACTASFSESISASTVTFTNVSSPTSGGSMFPVFSRWDFGDGASSSDWSATHTYSATGRYLVRLIVAYGDSITRTITCEDTAYDSVTITSLTRIISGSIIVDSTLSHLTYDTFKVWLITYDSTTDIIAAVDSAYTAGYDFVPYQFNSVTAGNYLIKAQDISTPSSGADFVPTYHTSSLHWNTADYVLFSTGILSGQDINMQNGIPTSGPGFIGGNVLYGAGKMTHSTGTVGDPVPGLLIYLMDASNKLVSSAYTDNSGNYSFSNIPTGTYTVYPENIGYTTTPWSSIVVSTGTPSINTINFKQTSTAIEPATTAIANVNESNGTIAIYPSPSDGNINLQWGNVSSKTAAVSVVNMTGQKVYQGELNINSNGKNQLNLSQLQSGIYFINIQAGNMQYNQKLSIQH
ncbi:MAG TPA: T9SS type A sorting domain-containing protein [Flavipsychrobacter sp.]|nr:T9SS type A sorting domain-containing protein [Flavipsychrobacter sp.]